MFFYQNLCSILEIQGKKWTPYDMETLSMLHISPREVCTFLNGDGEMDWKEAGIWIREGNGRRGGKLVDV